MSKHNGSPPKQEDQVKGDNLQDKNPKGFSRRLFMKGVGASAVSTSVVTAGLVTQTEKESSAQESSGPGAVPVSLRINGKTYNIKVEPRETLLEVLRDRLDMTGSKLVCNHGSCGACTVHVEGKAAYSCMMLAIQAQGKEILTIEGLADGDNLHPVQEAFIEADALQCGFCTPGFVMAMSAELDNNPNATHDEVKEAIAGNICRCGTYTQMFDAIDLARKKIGG